jgi:formylmethanofuran--tetrahydromethanopterin N-formyltransferase
MPDLEANGIPVDDTFAEAFDMIATGVVITADTADWARIAARIMTGYATSVIGCGCEGGLDRDLTPAETPDGRPGVRVLLFAVSVEELQKQLVNRAGQCVLTSPSSACYAGMEGEGRLRLGADLRYFGDGFQIGKRLGERRYWRIPVMDGEFLCESHTGYSKSAVGGGNLFIIARSRAAALAAAGAASHAASAVPDVILPFPGGIARSGSKIGSRYKAMVASTNELYCPTLKGAVDTALPADAGCVLEIVIDGLDEPAVAAAMRAAIGAAARTGPEGGVLRLSAGNYGGKLGRHHFHLRDLLP